MLHTLKTGTQQWGFELHIGNAMRLQEAGYDFLSDPTADTSNAGSLADRLATDIPFLFDAVWAIIEPLAVEAGYSKSQFANLMQPEDLIAARATVFKAWAEFQAGLNRGQAAMTISKRILVQVTTEDAVRRSVENSEPLAQLSDRFAASLEQRLDREFAKLPAAFEKAMAELEADETVDVKVVTP